MARCADCNKFVSYDDSTEPEADHIDVDEVAITGEVRIVLTCAECGQDLRESRFDIDIDIEEDFGEDHINTKEGHGIDVSCESIELTTHQQEKDAKGKSIPARFRKTFYGYSAEFLVTCECGKKQLYNSADSVQASHMEEL